VPVEVEGSLRCLQSHSQTWLGTALTLPKLTVHRVLRFSFPAEFEPKNERHVVPAIRDQLGFICNISGLEASQPCEVRAQRSGLRCEGPQQNRGRLTQAAHFGQ